MGYKKKVIVRKWGRSKPLVEVPEEWLEFWEIKTGEEVIQLADSIVIIAPKELEKRARRALEIAQELQE